MLKFMEIVDEACGANTIVDEALTDAEYFGVEFDATAEDALESLSLKIGEKIRNAVDKIKAWIRKMVNKIKDLFSKLFKVEHGEIDEGIYKSLTSYLAEFNKIDYQKFIGKESVVVNAIIRNRKNNTVEMPDEQLVDIRDNLVEMQTKLKELIHRFGGSGAISAAATPNGKKISVSFKALESEKNKFAADLQTVKHLTDLLYQITVINNNNHDDHYISASDDAGILMGACDLIQKIVTEKLAIIEYLHLSLIK